MATIDDKHSPLPANAGSADSTAVADSTEPALHGRAGQLLLSALGLGIAGDLLLREGLFGVGLVLWLGLLAGAALRLTRTASLTRRRSLLLWSGVAMLAALMTVLRDLEPLIPLQLFVVLGAAVLTSLETGGLTLRAARVRDYFIAGFSLPLQLVAGAPQLLQQADVGSTLRHQRTPAVVRGVMLALPLLLVFGSLFAVADAGFSRYVGSITNVVSIAALQHLLLVLVFAWLGASLLRIACRKPAGAAAASSAPTAVIRIGVVETHVVLALVSALFVAFVLLQLGYLFGGSEVIVGTSGLTVAEHARRGFFELVIVAALTLALLLACSATDCDRKLLRRYGTVLIVCVLVILASALQRLWLYTDAFGLTLSRFSALLAILWLVFNLLSFAATVLRNNPTGFASGIAVSLLACLLLLAAVNPAALVARINLERSAQQGIALDMHYLLNLRADALPLILQRYATLDAAAQCQVALHVGERYPVPLTDAPVVADDWRLWNLARSRARAAVAEFRQTVDVAAVVGRGC